MKFAILMSVALAGFCAFAETNVSNQAASRPRGSNAKEMIMARRHGGMVKKPGSAHGKVVVLNAQSRVKVDELSAAFKEIETRVHPDLEVKMGEVPEMVAVADAVRSAGGKLGVVIVDQKGIPALLTAPEEGWAIVNVGKLAADAPAKDILAARTRKEVLRAFALIGGGAFMCLDPIVMRSDIHVATDLDLIKAEKYGIDVCRALERGLPQSGVTPWRTVTYAVACQEGWAPQPTNVFQKAIWDKVHQLPTNPLPLKKPIK